MTTRTWGRAMRSVSGWVAAVAVLWWMTGWLGAGVQARAPHPIPDRRVAAGTVEGRVIGLDPRDRLGLPNGLEPVRPPRAEASARPQAIPPVAFLRGPVASTFSPPSATPASEPATLVQRNDSFSPSLLVVPVGAAVRFRNEDEEPHEVFSFSPDGPFDLGSLHEGESGSVRFDRPGVIRVYCRSHDRMRAAIVVVENDHHAVLEAEGVFRIPGVPAGRHTVVVWHPDRGQQTASITVPDGRTVHVEVDLR